MTSSSKTSALHYRIEAADLQAHLYGVTFTIAEPEAGQIVALPVWIPGSYLVREFAKHLQKLRASQGRRKPAVRQLDKHRWQIDCTPGVPLVLHYEVYAHDDSVRTAWLDTRRAFFNPTSLCLQAEGQQDRPHDLEVEGFDGIAGARLYTALKPLRVARKTGFGLYRAADYDELADSPVEIGDCWVGEFEAHGVPHRFVVAGAPPTFDGARLIEDSRRICEEAIAFWHPAAPKARGTRGSRDAGQRRTPHDRYVFMLNATGEGYGGLEHRHSTALICTRRDLPLLGQQNGTQAQGDGYITLLGLICHEYFHTWNVKRLRPAELARYDYAAENYTELLWFFEGFTSYYDDLLLRRAGLIDDAAYLKLLSKTINQVRQTPGRQVQSVAQSSFDAWVKYYRQDANSPNATVSYYTKGATVALALDLTLRQHGTGNGTLDHVMRLLWQSSEGGPIAESDVRQALAQVAGQSLNAELDAWVHGTRELPLQELLAAHGIDVKLDPATLAQRLGLRASEGDAAQRSSVKINTVLRGSAGEAAGLAPGDEVLAANGWRLHKLDDLLLYRQPKATRISRAAPAGTSGKVRYAATELLVSRDQRLLTLHLEWPEVDTQSIVWRLAVSDATRAQAWLETAQAG
ncbi:putative metalloprotease with PDZ domain [Comamonas sp. BIGb0124]|uniref:M61 family metallopeptidase n=1 Tax=Comamonas sp. BIGb0124 TaxID=2485130 RepID=UPI000F4A6860|nr:PDZ domain-containing protein [Comamonas sp. BIGb0124]ROR17893.1 putative metalloprotease with PDZ domain [Comamonas sp. BIGb0124]